MAFDISSYQEGYTDGFDDARRNYERPHGEWKKIKRSLGDGKHSTFIYRCPFCGYVEGCKANFCGKCGADMRGKEE